MQAQRKSIVNNSSLSSDTNRDFYERNRWLDERAVLVTCVVSHDPICLKHFP